MQENNTTYICEICKRDFDNIRGLVSHIAKYHNSTIQQYYNNYIKKENDGVCTECGKPTKFISLQYGYKTLCDDCIKRCGNVKRKKTWELKSYNEKQSIQQKIKNACIKKYNVLYYSQSDDWKNRYDDIKEKTKQTNIERYGCEYTSQSENMKQKTRQTNIERYGVENVMQNKEVQQKVKETNFKKYGVWCASQNEYVKNKISNTKKNFDNDKKKLISQKYKKTCIERYGVENVMQNKEVHQTALNTMMKLYGAYYTLSSKILTQKVINANLQRYGKKWYQQSEQGKHALSKILSSDTCQTKMKNTMLKRYCVERFVYTDEFKLYMSIMMTTPEMRRRIIDNSIKNNNEKYGADWYQQSEQYLLNLPDIQQKIKDTNNEKYGVDYYQQSEQYLLNLPNIQQKIYETKKKNHTFNSSKIEDEFAEYLNKNNYEFQRQYKSELYPFSCDFYLPKYDLYIEINGNWTHGKHSFNETNENDIELLNKWKSKGTDYYKNAIYTWTKLDVKKQQIAKDNKLNYIAVYSNDINDVIYQFKNTINQF